METPAEPKPSFASRLSKLQKRIVSALVMLTVALFCVLAGGMWFTALILLAGMQMMREWDNLNEGQDHRWKAAGFAYVGLPCITLLWLRGIQMPDVPNAGMRLALFVLFAVWATDIGAFFAGTRIGGPKLVPGISPNKTWAGLIGGMAAAGGIGLVCATFTPYPSGPVGAAGTGVLLAIVSQGGDIFESWLKRRAGVKDSGQLIPGHGGLLDRVDGLVFAIPVFALMALVSGVM